MSKLVPIQSIYCSKEDEARLCSFDVEVLSVPTTPLIHPMSRLWLINDGAGTLILNGKKYPIKKGTLVSVLPWQITDIIEVTAPLQFFVMAYYFDNINEIIKTFYNPDNVQLSIMQSMSKIPVIDFEASAYEHMRQLFLQVKAELRIQSNIDNFDSSAALNPPGLSNLYITNKLIEILVSYIRTSLTGPIPETPADTSEIFQFLYSHLNEKITLSDLSQKFYMSTSAISSYIKKPPGYLFSIY